MLKIVYRVLEISKLWRSEVLEVSGLVLKLTKELLQVVLTKIDEVFSN